MKNAVRKTINNMSMILGSRGYKDMSADELGEINEELEDVNNILNYIPNKDR